MGANTTSVGFQIHGDFITELVRGFVFEGNWRKGYGFLLDSLEGLTADAALDILKGKAKLEGVNDIEIKPDDQEQAVAARLDSLYGGTFSFANKLWRPYGYVDSFCQEDIRLAKLIEQGEDPSLLVNRHWRKALEMLSTSAEPSALDLRNQHLKFRGFFYLRDRSRDILVNAPLLNVQPYPVFCEVVDLDPPLWFKPNPDAQAVILKAFNEGRLENASSAEQDEDDQFEPIFAAPTRRREETAEEREERRRREAAQEQEWAEADAKRAKDIEAWRLRIQTQTDWDVEYGWLELSAYDKEAGRQVTLKVPRRAFICAALGRARARDLMPDYEPVCPYGLKMPGDDRFHTDSWLGAGMDLEKAYDETLPEQRLFMSELYAMQEKMLSQDFHVLARPEESFFTGPVVHDPALADSESILVLKAAAPQYADAALRSKAVIVETGSALAHLVVVSREAKVPVVRVDNALLHFPLGCRAAIDFNAKKVERKADF